MSKKAHCSWTWTMHEWLPKSRGGGKKGEVDKGGDKQINKNLKREKNFKNKIKRLIEGS